MHLLAILIIVTIACLMRHQTIPYETSWSERWHKTLFLFLFPSLLLLTSAIAILYMGCHGAMFGVKAGSLGCAVAASLIFFSWGCLLKLAYEGNRSIDKLAGYQQTWIGSIRARIVDTELPYSAQIGFWNPELVVSRGLLTTLDKEHLTAVLAHEQAHLYYRDTFWFFWLGWIRSFTSWLPNTEMLWQELLLLRELRADCQAATKVDFLLLAESLVTAAKASLESSPTCCANFNNYSIGDRLNERINFLLAETEPIPANKWHNWGWVSLLFLPLLTIPLHY